MKDSDLALSGYSTPFGIIVRFTQPYLRVCSSSSPSSTPFDVHPLRQRGRPKRRHGTLGEQRLGMDESTRLVFKELSWGIDAYHRGLKFANCLVESGVKIKTETGWVLFHGAVVRGEDLVGPIKKRGPVSSVR